MNYIVVAYYTYKTRYAEEVENLIESIEHFKLPMDIQGMESKGSWQKNCIHKPEFIREMIYKHPDNDILYVDADARIQQYPQLLDDVDFDLGICPFEEELLGGTLYFANNQKTRDLLDIWIDECHKNLEVWEITTLIRILPECEKKLKIKVHLLPPTYCQIFDLMKHYGDPVIEHFQASRRFRHEINRDNI